MYSDRSISHSSRNLRKRSWWQSKLSPNLHANSFLPKCHEKALRAFHLVSFGSIQLLLLADGLWLLFDLCLPDNFSSIRTIIDLNWGMDSLSEYLKIGLFRTSWVLSLLTAVFDLCYVVAGLTVGGNLALRMIFSLNGFNWLTGGIWLQFAPFKSIATLLSSLIAFSVKAMVGAYYACSAISSSSSPSLSGSFLPASFSWDPSSISLPTSNCLFLSYQEIKCPPRCLFLLERACWVTMVRSQLDALLLPILYPCANLRQSVVSCDIQVVQNLF